MELALGAFITPLKCLDTEDVLLADNICKFDCTFNILDFCYMRAALKAKAKEGEDFIQGNPELRNFYWKIRNEDRQDCFCNEYSNNEIVFEKQDDSFVLQKEIKFTINPHTETITGRTSQILFWDLRNFFDTQWKLDMKVTLSSDKLIVGGMCKVLSFHPKLTFIPMGFSINIPCNYKTAEPVLDET